MEPLPLHPPELSPTHQYSNVDCPLLVMEGNGLKSVIIPAPSDLKLAPSFSWGLLSPSCGCKALVSDWHVIPSGLKP